MKKKTWKKKCLSLGLSVCIMASSLPFNAFAESLPVPPVEPEASAETKIQPREETVPETRAETEIQPRADIEPEASAETEIQPRAETEAELAAEGEPPLEEGVRPFAAADISWEIKKTINGNLTLTEDKAFDGDVLIKNGILDLNGHTMTVNGNLFQSDGIVDVNGGTLAVAGDYRLQNPYFDNKGNPALGYSEGRLYMKDENARVAVGGDFITWARSSHSGFLTAGTMEIAGDFEAGHFVYNFISKDSHKVVLNGSAPQDVQFKSGSSRFHILELTQDFGNYTFSRLPCWDVLQKDGQDVSSQVFGDYRMEGSENGSGQRSCMITRYLGQDSEPEIPTEIMGYLVVGIESEAFKENSAIHKVSFPDSLTTINWDAFRDCRSLTEAELPPNLKSIGNSAFRSCSLKEIAFPEKLEKLGNCAFADCRSLQEITISKQMTEIDSYAFSGCASLKKATLEEGLEKVPEGMFMNCNALETVSLPESLQAIEWQSFYGCGRLKGIAVPADVTDIGGAVFCGCRALERVAIQEGVARIGDSAFEDCTSLKRIHLPDSVSQIGKSAFYGCSSMKEAVLPESLRSVGNYAFAGCSSLRQAVFSSQLSSLGVAAFQGCESLERVVLPSGLPSIPERAFYGCKSLFDIDIPEETAAIGENAFCNCQSLSGVAVRKSVTKIGSSAFGNYGKEFLLLVEAGSFAEEYAAANKLPYEYYVGDVKNFTINVKREDGSAVSGGCSIYWYHPDSGEVIGIGKTLRNLKEGTAYPYGILLGEELSRQYRQPALGTVTYQEGNAQKDIVLEPIGKARVAGSVKNTDGAEVGGAKIDVVQTFNGQYEERFSESATAEGKFQFEADDVDLLITVSAEGYYNKFLRVSPEQAKNGTHAIDAVLAPLPLNKVTLSFAEQEAAEPGEAPYIRSLDSADGLSFHLYNKTKQQEITDFTVQYPSLILGKEMADGGDVIQMSVTDAKGQRTAEEAEFALDGSGCAEAAIQFVQNGSCSIRSIKGNAEHTVLVFDTSGSYVSSGNVSTSYQSQPLEAGKYTAAILKKTALLQGVSSLEGLAGMGLAEGEDYALVPISVSNGVISVIDGVEVPELSDGKLSYTLQDKTYFTANCSTAVAGQYVTMCLAYEIAPKYKGAVQAVQFELPDGVAFVPGSLTVNKRVETFAQEGKRIRVPVKSDSGMIRFYVLPTETGAQNLYASLHVRQGGGTAVQPLGTSSFEVAAAQIVAPETTGQKRIAVRGKAVSNCQVTVYDNDVAVGTVTSKKNGSWLLEYDLADAYSYSYHVIYAVVQNSSLQAEIKTNQVGLVYDKNHTTPSEVRMYNIAHPALSTTPKGYETVFDLLHPSTAVPSYSYWPRFPTFTFQVSFAGGEPSALQEVSVITTDANGKDTYVPCAYDAAAGVWVGSHDYKSYQDVPVGVNVIYNGSGEITSQKLDDEEMAGYIQEVSQLAEEMQSEMEASLEVENLVEEEDFLQMDLMGDGQKLATYSMEELEYSEFHLEDWEAGEGYMEYEDENGDTFYTASVSDAGRFISYTAYPREQLLIQETISLPKQQARVLIPGNTWYEDLTDGYGALKDFLQTVASVEDTANKLVYVKFVHSNIAILKSKLAQMRELLSLKDCKGEDAIKGEARSECVKQMTVLEAELDIFGTEAYSYMTASVAVAAAFDFFKGKAVKAASKYTYAGGKKMYREVQQWMGKSGKGKLKRVVKWGLSNVSDWTGDRVGDLMDELGKVSAKVSGVLKVQEALEEKYDSLYQQMDDLMLYMASNTSFSCKAQRAADSCGDACVCGCNKRQGTKGAGCGCVPIMDPSGYVYEAVPSNRIEGAKAEIYSYDYPVDGNGIQSEQKEDIFWDAENYDQANPQKTDSSGIFAWDVPQGQWLVKVSKDGYYDADSRTVPDADQDGYLPVPPPQMDVNIALVSKDAPELERVSAYPKEIRLVFSQYMQIDTINTKNIKVTSGKKAVSGKLAPANAEYNYERTAQYASEFIFTPNVAISKEAGIVVSGVRNYNGVPMAKSVSKTAAVEEKPERLQMQETAALRYHGSAQVPVQVMPASAGAGRTLTVLSYAPGIAAVSSETIKADKNGRAVVSLDGKLPGQGMIAVFLDGTDLSAEAAVTVSLDGAGEKVSLETGGYKMRLSKNSYIYDGKEKKPGVTVDGLELGRDYTVSYQNNINAGTAVAIVEGINQYTGTLTEKFSISKGKQSLKASISKGSISVGGKAQITAKGIGAITYQSSKEKIAKVSRKGAVTGVSAGKAKITVKAAGNKNYKPDSFVITVTVKAKPLKVGSVFTDAKGILKYKVTKAAKGKKPGQAMLIGAAKKKLEKLNVPGKAKAPKTGESYDVASIGDQAFKGNPYLVSASLGKQVKTIGKHAFAGCKKLKSVTLGAKAQAIGAKAFYQCRKLSSIKITSKALKKVGANAIAGIHKKASIRVPAKKLKAYKKLLGKKAGKGAGVKIKK